ncbi:MAG: type II secretion system F family protein [Desulfitobacteriaceae bacterium]
MLMDYYNFSLLLTIICSTFLTTFFVFLALTTSQREASLADRLRGFTALRFYQTGSSTEKIGFKQVLTKLSSLAPLHWSKKLEKELQRASIPLNGGEFLALQTLITLFFFLIGLSLTHKLLVGLILGIPGFILPKIWLKNTQKNKNSQFNNQLIDALLIIANSLKAGFSFLQAIDLVSKEMSDPIAKELQYTLREMNYGTPTEEALLNLSDRVGNDDLDLVITAILIQRQVGGNLAEVLQSIHSTIQDRLRIKNEIKTLTAQGRMSGYIIAALPFGIAAVLTLINPSYMKLMVTQPLGWAMIGGGIISETIGFTIIRKIIAIKV